ncbi:nuclear transport factor 2 family protein [Xanthomonas sp. NCPPB 2654]|uniref:nuclear transport factor 2 family protein n=1 Tax=unclassified Xanthomonas TaxID=2643310 RepID=UPI0021E06B7E|nr:MULTISPECIES: nuclear transport factor 2 family protein [unclassified Xanthomonas]MDL5364566.1 nuclear transport factor 2 family protein [Xanthomonas sp. NCPPB 2654]UYC22119.1 nuclear transport factor 2 family protein [Xanthomonas sp. CFBP 8443]
MKGWGALLLLLACAADAGAAEPAADGSAGPLFDTIVALDQRLFGAYNSCDMAAFEQLFVPDVEFYHDTGGASWDRKTVVDNTRKWICGKVRRELVDGTLRVYPVKDFGAIEEGEHRFCELASGRCEGIAKFVMVWRQDQDGWKLTRVLSYGHRAAASPAP